MNTQLCNYIVVLVWLCLLSTGVAAQTESLPNGTFEGGNLADWTFYSSGGSTGFHINDGSFSGAAGAQCFNQSNLVVGPPISGSYDIISDQSNAGIAGFRCSLTIPDSISLANLSWKMRYESTALGTQPFTSPRHELRVQVLNASLQPVASLFGGSDLIFTTHYSIGSFSVDALSALRQMQGQLVYLQFEQQNDLGCWPMNIDDISLIISEVQVASTATIPTLGQWAIFLLLLLLLIVGVTVLREGTLRQDLIG